MSDQLPPGQPPIDQNTLDSLDGILSRPEMWAEPSDTVETNILDAILGAASSEAVPVPAASSASAPTDPGPQSASRPPPSTEHPDQANDELAQRRGARRQRATAGRGRALLGAAAVFLIAALGTLAFLRLPSSDSDGQIVALAGAGPLPEATAEAVVRDEGNGLSIVLDASALPAAPEGMFYAAWMVQPEPKLRIPIGTFHRRSGGAEIELWSGVDADRFSTLSVTLQSEDDPAAPGEVVLLGQIGRP